MLHPDLRAHAQAWAAERFDAEAWTPRTVARRAWAASLDLETPPLSAFAFGRALAQVEGLRLATRNGTVGYRGLRVD